jgi:hypothetical protein
MFNCCCRCLSNSRFEKLKETEDNETFPKVPISYRELKKYCRKGLSNEARLYWWPFLPRITSKTIIARYPNIAEISKNKYMKLNMKEYVDSSKDDCESTEECVNPSQQIDDMLNVLVTQYDLSEPGLVKAVLVIISNVIYPSDLCFHTICDIIDRADWYISLSSSKHHLKLFAFKELLSKYMPSSIDRLQEIGALEEEYLNLIFVDLFYSLMPMVYVSRIMDIFLLEGSKVLHRFGLGVIYMMSNFLLHNDEITTGKLYWNAMKDHMYNGDINFNILCDISYDMGKSIYHRVTSGTFARKRIKQIEMKGKIILGDKIKEKLKLNVILNNYKKNYFNISKLLDYHCKTRLLNYIPNNTLNSTKFELVFSTYNNGWNIETLYNCTYKRYPCIIIIKSLSQSAIFGAYISTPISPPSDDVKGDGLSFCFRLNGKNPNVYKWSKLNDNNMKIDKDSLSVHKHKWDDDRDNSLIEMKYISSHNSNNNSNNYAQISFVENVLDSYEEHYMTITQFAICNLDGISIGGSAEFGTNAIRLDSELKRCSSGPSDTFGNSPLVTEEEFDPFLVGDIEIFCG